MTDIQPDLKGLGGRLKAARDKKKLTQADLRPLLGNDPPRQATISDWETGKTFPPLDTVVRMASVLEVSWFELLTGRDPAEFADAEAMGYRLMASVVQEIEERKVAARPSGATSPPTPESPVETEGAEAVRIQAEAEQDLPDTEEGPDKERDVG